MKSYNDIFNYYKQFDQEHIFKYWEEIDETARKILISQAEDIDLAQLNSAYLENFQDKININEIKPIEYIAYPQVPRNDSNWGMAKNIGEAAIRLGKLAVFTPAGGQGTRLGLNAPKGTLPVTILSKKSLFQVFAEKILAASKKYEIGIPWYIMTSKENYKETILFFENNSFFGMDKKLVSFFQQGMMPALNLDGKILMKNKSELLLLPDGHGGAFKALYKSGSFLDMESKGIEIVSFFQVDNPMVNCIDPYFIGFHVINNSEISSKICLKTEPSEKVGLIVRTQNSVNTIEYSDFPENLALLRDNDGGLTFRCGSIGIHLFQRKLIMKIGNDENPDFKMPYHKAIKKMDYLNVNGELVKPENPNGIKFEMFGFDAMNFTSNVTVMETKREYEFSPVKNASGDSSLITCLEDQKREFSRWVLSAGGKLELNEHGLPIIEFEVSPFFASNEDDFLEKFKGEPIHNGLIL